MNEEPRYGYKIHAFELYSTRIMFGCMKSFATAIKIHAFELYSTGIMFGCMKSLATAIRCTQ